MKISRKKSKKTTTFCFLSVFWWEKVYIYKISHFIQFRKLLRKVAF